jgi:hypothetical protein
LRYDEVIEHIELKNSEILEDQSNKDEVLTE